MELQIFNNPRYGKVSGYLDENGTAFLDAEDVARGLGFVQAQEKLSPTSGGKTYTSIRWERINGYLKEFGYTKTVGKGDFLPENMVYRLAMKANNETAKDFQAWLADEVVPTIRKTGGYSLKSYKEIIADPDFIIAVGQALKVEKEKVAQLTQENAVLNQQVAELTPKANYCAVVLNCKGLVSISKIAKDYGLSAIQMNKLLNQLGVQFNQGGIWLLYQKYAHLGWTQTKTHIYTNSEGETCSKVLTYWTQLGRIGLYHLLKDKGYLPTIELNQKNIG